jgi:hypothetical protein
VTWALLVASLVLGLAALVRIGDPAATGLDGVTGVIHLPWAVTTALASLVSLAIIVFLVGLLLRLRSRRPDDETIVFEATAPRQPWLHALAQLLSFANALVIGYLLWRNVGTLDGLQGLGQAGGLDGMFPEQIRPHAPWLVTWTFAGIALVVAAAALALAVWFTSGDRLAKWWARKEEEEQDAPPPPLVAAVDESLDDLRDETDARRAIIRCYARFERAAADSGLRRVPWQTPMEFIRETLRRLPAPGTAVRALTGLFELARFSDRALGPGERDRALDALDDIKAAIDAAR